MNFSRNLKYFLKGNIFGRANLFYGHYHILKDYCNVKKPYIITGEIQHGWRRDNGISPKVFPTKKNYKFFIWNKYNLKEARKKGLKNVIPIGAPFLYLDSSIETQNKSKELLLFPLHSSSSSFKFKNVIKSYKKYLEDIKEIESNFKDITVCLYWTEYKNKELVNLILEQGYKVTTLGHRDNNPNFLKDFMELTSKHEYVSSNKFSTAIFYSLYLGKKTFIFGDFFSKDDISADYHISIGKQENRMRKTYPKLLWKNFEGEKHKQIGAKELGLEFKKSPEELRRVLGFYPKAQFKYMAKLPFYRFSYHIN